MRTRRCFSLTLLAGSALVAPRAWAQAAPPTPSEHESAAADTPTSTRGGVEDIVVTAQRRTERLQDVPISALVISGATAARENITSLEDVARNVPSIHLVGTIGRSGALFIRGVGSGNNPSFDQSVSTFVDGVYHGRARMSSNVLLDLERIEILKGPQSIFFGNNAIAGALNVVSRLPDSDFDGWARAFYGGGGRYALEGAVNVPLSDTFAARAAVTFNGTGGWLHNVTTNRDGPDQDNMGGRLTLRWRPDSNFDAVLKVEASRNRNHTGFISQIADCPPPAPFSIARGFCPQVISTGSPTGFRNPNYARNDGERVDLDTQEAVLTLNYHVGENTLTSITAYNHYNYLLNLDTDLTPLTLMNASVPERYGQFSQELRFASPAERPIEYLFGLYYQSDVVDNDLDFNFARLNAAISANPAFAALVPFLPLGQTIRFRQHEQTYSGFASLNWHINNELSLSAGLRASWVDKQFNWQLFYGTATRDFGGIVPLPAAIATLPTSLGTGVATSLASQRSDHAWMPSAQLQYAPTRDVRFYLSYSRGFKAGGFNYADVSGILANFPFQPETVDAFEAGLKSEWFNHRLLFNIALFRSNYRNLQTAVTVPNAAGAYVSLVSNAARSVSQGVELETRWAPSSRFNIGANLSYLDSHYQRYPNASTTALQQLQLAQCLAATPAPATACNAFRSQDLSGKRTQNAPRWSGSATVNYSVPLPSDYQVTFSGTGEFATTQYFNPVADPVGADNGYFRLDGRITFETPNRRLALDLIGENLTNALIFDNLQPMAGGGLGSRQFLAQQPRYFAVQVRYQW